MLGDVVVANTLANFELFGDLSMGETLAREFKDFGDEATVLRLMGASGILIPISIGGIESSELPQRLPVPAAIHEFEAVNCRGRNPIPLGDDVSLVLASHDVLQDGQFRVRR